MSILRATERMLRSRLEAPSWYSPRHVLLASFPKSGSTWMRFILANVSREIGDFDLEVDFHTLARYVPEIRRNRSLSGRIETPGMPLFLKTHFPWTRAFRRYRTIAVVRHPAQVLPSYYDHLKGAAVRNLPSLDEFLTHWRYGADAWRDWHLRWHTTVDYFVHYEDLVAHPEGTVSEMLDSLGIQLKEGVIETAVKRSSREEMRRLLEKRGDPNLQNPAFEFVGRDTQRSGRTRLSTEQRDYVERVARPALELLGYGTSG